MNDKMNTWIRRQRVALLKLLTTIGDLAIDRLSESLRLAPTAAPIVVPCSIRIAEEELRYCATRWTE